MNIPQAFPIRELGKRQAEEWLPARGSLDSVVPLVAVDALAEPGKRNEGHQLGEDHAAKVHELYTLVNESAPFLT